jgi:hypothetical protein
MLKFIFFCVLGIIILRWVLKKAVVLMFETAGKQMMREMERREQERFDFEKDGIYIKKPKQTRRPADDDFTDYEEIK